jgi:hypothetical protein
LLNRHRFEACDWDRERPLDVAGDRVALGTEAVSCHRGANLLRAAGAGIVVGAVLVLRHWFVVVASVVLLYRLVIALLNVLGYGLVIATLNVTDPNFRLWASLWTRSRCVIAGPGTAVVAADLENVVPGRRCRAGANEPPGKSETEYRKAHVVHGASIVGVIQFPAKPSAGSITH